MGSEMCIRDRSSLLSLSNWQTAYTSFPGMLQSISNSILSWVAMVLAIGFVLIFGLGPILYRQYQAGYKDFMPTQNYPKWSFFLIYFLVLISNCFYFVFVKQNNYCLLYTSPSPRDLSTSRMPSSA